MKSKSLNNSKRYRDYVGLKNRVLEFLLDYYLSKIDEQVDFVRGIVDKATHYYTWQTKEDFPTQCRRFHHSIDRPFDMAAAFAANQVAHMKRAIYAFSFIAENAAMVDILGGEISEPDKAKAENLDTMAGGDARARVFYQFNKLKAKVQKAFEQALLVSDTPDEAVARVLAQMPKKTRRAEVRRVIRKPKPLKEADRPSKPAKFGFITDDAWNALVDDYLDTLPGRGPDDMVKVPSETGFRDRYAWELEQEITNDFVNDVRKGQHDGAKKAGVQEFVWVAVTDDRTDECCLWRDGLTTKEIEEQLRGAHRGDECKTSVPPAHFNCRCDLAPVTGTLPEVDELGDFETWLTK